MWSLTTKWWSPWLVWTVSEGPPIRLMLIINLNLWMPSASLGYPWKLEPFIFIAAPPIKEPQRRYGHVKTWFKCMSFVAKFNWPPVLLSYPRANRYASPPHGPHYRSARPRGYRAEWTPPSRSFWLPNSHTTEWRCCWKLSHFVTFIVIEWIN